MTARESRDASDGNAKLTVTSPARADIDGVFDSYLVSTVMLVESDRLRRELGTSFANILRQVTTELLPMPTC
jgi:hypothetical protein